MSDSDFYRRDYMEDWPQSEPERMPEELPTLTTARIARAIARLAINMELLEARVSDLERQLAEKGSE